MIHHIWRRTADCGSKVCREPIFELRDELDFGVFFSDPTKTSMVVGAGEEAGADEDDFHILNRKRGEVDQEEKKEKKRMRVVDATKTKAKVVHF